MRAIYPGANPKVIAETVSVPLEEQINGAEGMMYMKSVAGSDGVLQMTITFRPDEDASRALAALTRDGTPVSTAVREARRFPATRP